MSPPPLSPPIALARRAPHALAVASSPAPTPLPAVPDALWSQLQQHAGGDVARGRWPSYLTALHDLCRAGLPLALAAAHYLAETAVGQSPNTLAAKCRDLVAFIRWFVQLNQHADPQQWLPRDSRLYLRHLEQQGGAAASINRGLATLRHFARWLHDQPGAIFARSGMPTRGIRELHTEEGDSKKLDPRQMHALFKAADNLVTLAQHRRARPQRNRAILALLYFTGLRVQELCSLELAQLRGNHLVDVVRKGRVRSRALYVVAEAQRSLQAYLQSERPLDDPQNGAGPLVLSPQRGMGMDRRDVARALDLIAAEANKRRDDPIHLHPHRLRHTFGSLHRAKSASDSETAAALGHTSLKYVGRYTRQTEEERALRLEEIFADDL